MITGIHCGSVAGCMKTTNVSGSASPFFFFACPLFDPLGNNHTNDSWISLWTRCWWYNSNSIQVFAFQYTDTMMLLSEAEEEQLYQVLIGQESAPALLHSAGRPPLSRDVPTFIRQNLRKGCPAVVWLVERAVRPAWCPVGRLPGDGVLSKCCLQTHTHTHS